MEPRSSATAQVDDAQPLVLVVGSPDDRAEAVFEILRGWADAGLLRPAYWIPVQDSVDGRLTTRILGGDGTREAHLLDAIGGRAWTHYDLVLVQPVAAGESGRRENVLFAEKVRQFLEGTVLPLGSRVLSTNLIVPTTDARDIPQDLLAPGWDLNLVGSPEERHSTRHPNVLVDADSNLAGHAAALTASVAGLWTSMDPSPMAWAVGESGDGEASPRVVRSFVRVVAGGDVDRALAAEVLHPVDDTWRIPATDGAALVPAEDPGRLVDELVGRATDLGAGAFVYATPPEPVLADRPTVNLRALWSAFVEFCMVLVRPLTAVPARVVRAVESGVNRKAFGPDGAHQFAFGGADAEQRRSTAAILRDLTQDVDSTSLFGQQELAEQAMRRLGSTDRVEAPATVAWAELRQCVFGLIDGGALPAGMRDDGGAGGPRRLVTHPALLVPDSNAARWQVPDDLVGPGKLSQRYWRYELPPCDPAHTDELVALLFSCQQDHERQAREERDLAEDKRQHVAELEAQRVGATGEAAAGIVASISMFSDEVALHERRAAELEATARRFSEALAALQHWAEPRRPTLVWRVGDRAAGELRRAVADQQQACVDAQQPVALEAEPLRRAQRSARWWLAVALVLLGGGGYALGRFLIDWWQAALVAVAVFAVVFVLVFLRYNRTRSSIQAEYERSVLRQVNGLRLLAHAAREVSRLSTVYAIFVDWAEILGFHAHAPWVPTPEPELREERLEVDAAQLPPSVLVGGGELGAERFATLCNRTAREIQREAWMSETFAAAASASMRRKARQDGLEADRLDPDRDAPGEPTGARSFLLGELRTHRPQHEAYAQAAAHVARYCAGLEPDELFDEVVLADGRRQEVRSFVGEIIPPPSEIVPGMVADAFASDARVDAKHDRVESYVWSPPGFVAATSVVVRPARSGEAGVSMQCVRLDVTNKMDPHALSLFAAAAYQPVRRATPEHPDDW